MVAPYLIGHRQAKEANMSSYKKKGATDIKATTVGIDSIKNFFQFHGVDEHSKKVFS